MKKQRRLSIWLFFGAVYVLSAILCLPVLLSGKGMSTLPNTILVALMTFVPSGMGILFTTLTRDPERRRDFWRRVLHWPRQQTKLALAGILILPFNVVTAYLLASFLNGQPISLDYALRLFSDWKALLVFLFVELTFGAFSEELGWRGYALDELQSRWSALKSSLVLGVIWALWHTPAFLIPGLSQYETGGLFSYNYFFFVISVTLGSVIHTWVYNNTRRSILVAGLLMHFTQNVAMIFLGGIFDDFKMPPAYWLVLPVLTGITVVVLIAIYGARTLTRPSDRMDNPDLAGRGSPDPARV
jgi:membrane protease YdiL (CAAX protease family)